LTRDSWRQDTTGQQLRDFAVLSNAEAAIEVGRRRPSGRYVLSAEWQFNVLLDGSPWRHVLPAFSGRFDLEFSWERLALARDISSGLPND
jgi:hypothetical protein